ncbi:choice-of-anchor J domain-containing protein [Porphyromonas gulae]|uniref:choice-of-anchor J domain-containing protein n=1 Tax=Porphyromonas gulae TaxID=111105 RepID=UPI0026F33DE8|nr:choice-of-anchor J domain-containing protein [Porphyromonas gulae]
MMKSIVFRAFLTILLSWAAITNPTAQKISGMNASCLAAPAQPDTILYESFENGPVPNGWLVIDADGDGFSWGHYLNAYDAFSGHNGGHCSLSASYVSGIGPVTPDNYLITPKVEGAKRVKYWVSTQDANYSAEHYAVMVSTTGTAVEDFQMLFEETMTGKPIGEWYERTITLPAGTKYIAWRHYNCTDMFFLKLDDVTVYNSAAEPEPVTDFVVSLIENNKGRLKWNYPNGYEPDKTDDKDRLQLAGYNIYANGSLLVHIQDPTVLEYIDETYSSRDDQVEVEYCVTAVYNDNIESQSVCDKLNYTVTSLDNIQSDTSLKIYPNPASHVLRIEG